MNRLNNYIDALRADTSPRHALAGGPHPSSSEMAAFRMAARLSALRPGRGEPDSQFISSLRERICDFAADRNNIENKES